MSLCIAAIQSMTYAVKAQKILSTKNIGAEVIKLDPTITKRGCAWGIQFDCMEVEDVRKVLYSRNIPFGEIIGSSKY